MSVLVTNNGTGALLVGVTSLDGALLLRAGQGMRFPAPVVDKDWFYVTAQDELGNVELMRCTARDGDTLTVRRGIGGTIARDFAADSVIELRPCAELFADKVDYDVYNSKIAELNSTIEALRAELTTKINQLSASTNVAIDNVTETAEKTYMPYAGGKFTGAVTATNITADKVTATTIATK